MCKGKLYLLRFVTKIKQSFKWFETKCENIALIKQVEKIGTNNEDLKTTTFSLYKRRWNGGKQQDIASKYFDNERFNGGLGKYSSLAKKGIVLYLVGD
jgi:hypothetical protein